jgi:hypothetical protein
MTEAQDPATPEADAGAVKIGIWGPPQSGKTTYLAALPLATRADNPGLGTWKIYPRSHAAKDLLVRFNRALEVERKFPEPTPAGTVAPLEWLFAGHPAAAKPDRRRTKRERPVSRFALDLIDVYGGVYAHDRAKAGVTGEVASRALDHLAQAQAIIYLFDPIGEKENRNSHTYMTSTVPELMLRAATAGKTEPYLPHQVSVCITKFDNPKLFQQARRAGLVTYGPDGIPRVRDTDAEQFFDELCTGTFWKDDYEEGYVAAMAIRDELKRLFRPERIKYFVTSSIGFWMAPPAPGESISRFNEGNFANYHKKGGQVRIRGTVRPINVLEPLISLQQRIAGQG